MNNDFTRVINTTEDAYTSGPIVTVKEITVHSSLTSVVSLFERDRLHKRSSQEINKKLA